MKPGKTFLVLLLAASYAVAGPIDGESNSVVYICSSSVLLCVANLMCVPSCSIVPSIVALPPPEKEAVIFYENNVPPYDEGARVDRQVQEDPTLQEPSVPSKAAIVCICT